MKKNIKDFINITSQLTGGQMSGGFIAIRGGLTLNELGTNRSGGCSNTGSCTSTNASSCNNDGDCSKTTNSFNCDNVQTCRF